MNKEERFRGYIIRYDASADRWTVHQPGKEKAMGAPLRKCFRTAETAKSWVAFTQQCYRASRPQKEARK